ncbi:hypothetical protein Tco_1383277 [Tanacetum coccineum]
MNTVGERFDKKEVEARNILAILKEQNKDNVSTIKDIYNTQSEIRKAQKVGETTMQVQCDWESFYSTWKLLEDSPTWISYLENYKQLQLVLRKYPRALSYLDEQWGGGEYIPLDSVDIFWRTLNVSWSEPVEDDDIQCEDVLQHFKEKFSIQNAVKWKLVVLRAVALRSMVLSEDSGLELGSDVSTAS